MFEIKFKETIQKILCDSDFSNLTVQYVISLEECSKDASNYKIESNASLSLSNSYALISSIDNYMRSCSFELNKFLQKEQQIFISLTIKEKQQSNTKKDSNEQLPTFFPVEPRYCFDQIILPDKLIGQIKEALNIIQYQDLIYNQWGFSEVDSIPKSILNFYGPPGTGKTMCAHAIAKAINKKLLALNYAEIESKYVGEAPKNLQAAFDVAKNNDCVLFFDEADSFLGKRITNVVQGADQALNSLRSQMLILLEEFKGIVIFATNLVTNFDTAFESRILKHLKFDLPNEDARISIIEKMIPSKLPIEKKFNDEELRSLSQIVDGLSGREIKNAILETLLTKADSKQQEQMFNYDDFKSGFLLKKEQYEELRNTKTGDKKKKILDAIKKGNIETKDEKEENNEQATQS
ncbi:ATP-binding protein [Hoylesella timonensis]